LLCIRCGANCDDKARDCDLCGQIFVDAQGRDIAGVRRERRDSHWVPDAFAPGELVGGHLRVIKKVRAVPDGQHYLVRDEYSEQQYLLHALQKGLVQTSEEQNRLLHAMKQARITAECETDRAYVMLPNPQAVTLFEAWRKLPQDGACAWLKQLEVVITSLCDSLLRVHPRVCHGLLNPHNVLLDNDEVKVGSMHFLYGVLMKPYLVALRLHSNVIGFVAPELRSLSTQVDQRVDVYSMGRLLEWMLQVVVPTALPEPLMAVVRRSTHAHPNHRHADLAQFRAEFVEAMASVLNEKRMKPLVFSLAAVRGHKKDRAGQIAALTSGVFVVAATLLMGAKTFFTV
jgi:hypothetical protein